FKIKIMVVGIRAKTYFLYYSLLCFGFNFLLLFLLFVFELRIVYDLTYWRFCGRRYFNQIQSFIFSHFYSCIQIENAPVAVLANYSNLSGADSSINPVGFFYSSAKIWSSSFTNWYLPFLIFKIS